MRAVRLLRFALMLLPALFGGVAASADDPKTHPVGWQAWEKSVFERAGRENRYIILHMAAVWCHWCHVMEGTTYRVRTSDGLAMAPSLRAGRGQPG